MFRRCTLILAIATSACATPMVDARDLEVIEKGFGIYSQEDDEDLVLLEASDAVKCELGVSFGAQVDLQFEAKGSVVVPIQGVWIEPATPGVSDRTKEIFPQPLQITKGSYGVGFETLAVLETPEDLVPGDYTLRFFDPHGDRVYYERTFHVTGCP